MIRTKIVCTLGPTSREPEMLERLIQAGMDVARLNFSHGDHAYHGETIQRVREASQRLNHPVALLADLQGPKIRVGVMDGEGVPIEDGEEITLTIRDITGKRLNREQSNPQTIAALIPIQYERLPRDVKPGDQILIDDGLMEIEVIGSSTTDITCRVVTGGLLKSKKGLNLPGTYLSVPAITRKDRADLDFAIANEVDWVALSFVRAANEINEIKDYVNVNRNGERRIRIISKIEKPEALNNIDEIIKASDGIMVARGDLGIEIPAEKVPVVQKSLIRKSNALGKPVITATQMLDSMIRNPRPTRAEASDVANAILDGTDAIMLSGETASGKYPVESVQTMVKIAKEIEREMFTRTWKAPSFTSEFADDVSDSVCRATVYTAEAIDAQAIITSTATGYTARGIARYRPHKPIIAVTPSPLVQRQLLLSWGTYPLLADGANTTDRIIRDGVAAATKAGLVSHGDRVVLTAGVANNMPGSTNLMIVEKVETAGQIDFPPISDHDR